MLAFFFPPGPGDIALLAGVGFFLLLPKIHRGYCYARWLKSHDATWLNPDEQWQPPWFILAIVSLLVFFIVLAISVKATR